MIPAFGEHECTHCEDAAQSRRHLRLARAGVVRLVLERQLAFGAADDVLAGVVEVEVAEHHAQELAENRWRGRWRGPRHRPSPSPSPIAHRPFAASSSARTPSRRWALGVPCRVPSPAGCSRLCRSPRRRAVPRGLPGTCARSARGRARPGAGRSRWRRSRSPLSPPDTGSPGRRSRSAALRSPSRFKAWLRRMPCGSRRRSAQR